MLGYCVLARFWAENAAGFFSGFRFGVPVFLRSCSSSLPFCSSSFSSGGRPGCPFLPSLCLSPGLQNFRYMARPERSYTCSFLSPLSARVGRRSPSLPPSFCPLSLSLYLFSLSLLSLTCMLFLEGLRAPSATKLEATTGM